MTAQQPRSRQPKHLTLDAGIFQVRVPSLGRDKEILLSWLDASRYSLAAVYEDFLSADGQSGVRTYTVICSKDRNLIRPGRHLPEWTESEILAHWRAKQHPTVEA